MYHGIVSRNSLFPDLFNLPLDVNLTIFIDMIRKKDGLFVGDGLNEAINKVSIL